MFNKALKRVRGLSSLITDRDNSFEEAITHSVKIDLNKELDPKQKTIQAFNIDT